MKVTLDNRSKSDKMTAVEERPMNFKALKETVLNERQVQVEADAALAQDLASDNVAISLTGTNAVDALFNWIDS
jgi:4-aminobutyrate aminotransferase-like enzyme